jgi:hypothetical protein
MTRTQSYLLTLLDDWGRNKTSGQITISIKQGSVLDVVEAERKRPDDLPLPRIFDQRDPTD